MAKINIKLNNVFPKPVYAVINAVFILVILSGGFFLLQYSSFPGSAAGILKYLISDVFAYMNIVTLAVILAFIYAIINRIWLSCAVFSLVCGVISIINSYVIKFHTMPLSFLVLRNAGTALNVMGEYDFTPRWDVIFLAAGTVGLVFISVIYHIFTDENRSDNRNRLLKSVLVSAAAVAVFYGIYISPLSPVPGGIISWSWKNGYGKYGYVVCSVESYFTAKNAVSRPRGYEEGIETDIIKETEPVKGTGRNPDIILILNETFYDPAVLCDINPDIPYMPNISRMDNLQTGYAVVPGSGGGTNSSEYELLTGNSLQLMPGVTPFNTLDLNGANSIVSLLKQQGYSTLGCHIASPMNYSRGIGYPALGFDKSCFEDDFIDLTFYGERGYESDESVYNNIIRWYEEMDDSKPKFIYGLTIQNHGGHDLNPPEYDLVHTQNDFGEHTGKVNELLTGILQSDRAFKNLTDYFKTSDRPVVVCMVGDHSPSFAPGLADPSMPAEEYSLNIRKVPLIIWANFPLEEKELGTMSMNMVAPTLLYTAQVRLSQYYSYILEMKNSVPVLTSYDVYYDSDGNIYSYNDDMGEQHRKTVDDYFFLEYRNLTAGKNMDIYK